MGITSKKQGGRSERAVGSKAAICLCWGSLPNLGFDELAYVAGHNGYREISITAGHYQRARAHGRSDLELQRTLARNGVEVGVIDPLIGPLPGTPAAQEVRPEWRHFFEYEYIDCLTAATAVGARTINVAHFLGDPTTPLDDLASTISEIAHKAETNGLQISVEFIPGTGISDFARAFEIVARVGSPNVGIMLDTWHFARSGGTTDQLRGNAGSSVIEVQLSDLRQTNSDRPYKPIRASATRRGRVAASGNCPGTGGTRSADGLRG